MTLQGANVILNRLFAMVWDDLVLGLNASISRTKEPNKPRPKPGLEGVNPGVESCKSFGMIVEAGGGRGGST